MSGLIIPSNPQAVLAALNSVGYDVNKAQEFTKHVRDVRDADLQGAQKLGDRFEAVKSLNNTVIPRSGETSKLVSPEGGTMTPTESRNSQDDDTRQRTEAACAPQPEDSVPPAPTAEQLSFAFGNPAYQPPKELTGGPGTAKDSKPSASAVGGAGGAQRLQNGNVVDLPRTVEASGECVSLDNSPRKLAEREMAAKKASGFRLAAGETWESATDKRTKEITKHFVDNGGAHQVNPRRLAQQTAETCEKAGLRMTAADVDALENHYHNHFAQNGGFLRTGGEISQYEANARDGMRLSISSVLGGIAGGGIGSIAGAVVGSVAGPIGTVVGGAVGGGLGTLVGAIMGGGAQANPALSMLPALASNPTAMGMGGALSTVGMLPMLASAMGGGGGGFQGMMAGIGGFQYAAAGFHNQITSLMRRQAIADNDMEIQGLLNNPNIPIEKLVAMWALKVSKRQELELKDKMAKAEMARQREKQMESITGMLSAIPVVGSAAAGAFQMAQSQMGGPQAQSSTALNLEVQMAMEEWKRGIEIASNIMKALHDMQMTIINNTR